MKRTSIIHLLLILLLATACNKQLDELRPHNVIFEDRQFDNPEGFTKAMTGIYSLVAGRAVPPVVGMSYHDMLMYLSDAKGNIIRSLDDQINEKTDAFDYVNSAGRDFSYSYHYWRGSYHVLLHVNKLLANVDADETNPTILQAKAEALFVRAFTYFNLVRLYGKPYYQNPDESLGVMLVLTDDVDASFAPGRASVADVYAQIVTDLEEATPLFSQDKSNSYAGRYAAYALLSRVYLYMGGTFEDPNVDANQKAFDYADQVIRESPHQLLEADAYTTYYETDNVGNPEDIFAVNTRNNAANGIANLYMMGPSSSGGLYRPSPYFLSLLAPEDLRNHFYIENVTPGFEDEYRAAAKYAIDYNGLYSRSPVRYLRLAEVYLNRAEAAVKLNRDEDALEDVNVIRNRSELTTLSGLSSEVLFQEILKQRKLELAFEGHASFDEFRNGLPMVRDYTSARSGEMTVAPTDNNIIMKIPNEEIADNPNLDQN